MKIAVFGPGAIGSTFAFHLVRAGHDVTVVARGKRLAQLQRDHAIVKVGGERAAVEVATALDPTIEWDLVLVTVLVSQVDAVLPSLAASKAKSVMFMFNTFESLDRLRDVVGAPRFAFGFPAILATFENGALSSRVVTRPLCTTVTDERWARVFTDAKIPTVVSSDMESWLRTHVAFVVPAMIALTTAHDRGAGVSWAEALDLGRASREGFRVVRELGSSITPGPMVPISRLPATVQASLLWVMSRVPEIRKSGVAGPGEARALIDAMTVAAPGRTSALLAVRP